MATDRVEFFLKFLTQPGKIGSITPSSTRLTKRMMANLPWEQMRLIVELGAGTGVFTSYIANRVHNDCSVLVFEQNKEMREALQARYPAFFYASQAQTLSRQRQELCLPKADCVVSGLPFATFPGVLRARIIRQVYDNLANDGMFVAFQYSPLISGLLKRCFSRVETGFVLRNMPPAFVYLCRK